MTSRATIPPECSARTRLKALAEMAARPLDVLVVGGGITGAGVALEAVLRGLRVGLVERGDFASGTSSKSSKLVHGGLRYLQQGNISLTATACAERDLLQSRLAPHLVRPLDFVVPCYSRWDRMKFSAGLWFYDFLARHGSLPSHGALDARGALERIPTLRSDGLRGAITYWDCQTDDARLTLEVIKTASAAGALVANAVDVLEPRTLDGRVVGVRLRDRVTNAEHAVDARAVVNATGVWLDDLRGKADPRARSIVRPTKGVHLVIPRDRIRNSCAMLLPSPADGRFIFVLPWAEWDIIGTTDTDHLEARDAAVARPADLEYLLRLVRLHLPGAGISAGDVRTTFAGLRPLIGDPSDMSRHASKVSREHAIEQSPLGLWSIAGGKLTTFRDMAIDLTGQMLAAWRAEGYEPQVGPSRTDSTMLGQFPLGMPEAGWKERAVASLTATIGQESLARLLVDHYGPSAVAIGACAEGLDDPWGPIVEGMPLCRAEVRFHARYEMALGVADVLSRRTRWCVFAPDLACAAAHAVAEVLRAELGWRSQELMQALSALEAEVARHAVPPTTGLPNLPPAMENVT